MNVSIYLRAFFLLIHSLSFKTLQLPGAIFIAQTREWIGHTLNITINHRVCSHHVISTLRLIALHLIFLSLDHCNFVLL
jgi:hypothetical protein